MDQAQWTILVTVLRQVARSFGRSRRHKFTDFLIAKFYFWAVWHERPMTWAVDPVHYNRLFRPRKIPSISQLNRRIASDRFQRLLQRVHEKLAATDAWGTICIDGRALEVGAHSRDRDARWGHAPGGGAGIGYKVHALVTADRKIPVFTVVALNHHEMPVARVMLTHTPPLRPGSLVLTDGNYDSHVLHKDVHAHGGWMITRPRGRGKHAVTRRQMGPARRLLPDLSELDPQLIRRTYKERIRIEQVFGNNCVTPGLLDHLPSFVRGLPRVRRWVGAKIGLYHARLTAKSRLKNVE